MRFPLIILALCAPAYGQTEAFLEIDRPAGPAHGWGHVLLPLDDIDADGVPDLLIGRSSFSSTQIATVHSGATGALLHNLAAPFAQMFHGDSFMTIADENGDGLREILAVASVSISVPAPRGKLLVYSSADGTLLREVVVAPGLLLRSQTQFDALTPGDVDADGFDDVLCWTVSAAWPTSVVPLTLLSGSTGEVLSVALPEPGTSVRTGPIAALSDHDGDGLDDVAILTQMGTTRRIEVRSSADGSILGSFASPGLDGFTGNHEAFESIDDLDGDGLRDLAVGGVFEGYVGLYSTGTGQLIRSWDCLTTGSSCFGSRIVQTADLNGNGSADLLTIESDSIASADLRIFGLDPLSGDILFEQVISDLSGGYSDRVRITVLGDVDPLGFPAFAVELGGNHRVAFHRVLPELGDKDCWGATDALGNLADLTIRGSSSLGSSRVDLTLTVGAPSALAAFLFGTERDHYTVGPAIFCVGQRPGLIRVGLLDSTGSTNQTVDLSALGAMAMQTWSFQGIFRDAAAGGVRASNAVTVVIQP